MAENHNRFDSKFKVVGAFWEPRDPSVVYTGTLEVGQAEITFTTAPEYEPELLTKQPARTITRVLRSESRFEVMHGFTEDGHCTLLGLVEVHRPGVANFELNQSVQAVSYHVGAFVGGVHTEDFEGKCITSVRFTFSGLSDWLPKGTREIWGADRVTIEVPFEAPELLRFSLRERRIEVTLKIFSELASDESDGARLNRSIPSIEIKPANEESLEWFLDIGNQLENLFSLLTGGSLALETLFIRVRDEDGHVVMKRTYRFKRFKVFDSVQCSPSQLAQCIAIWLSEPPGFRSVENVALGVVRKGDLFIETEFLSLSQALEGFHRFTAKLQVTDKAEFRRIRKKIVALLADENVNQQLTERICAALSHVNEQTFASRLTELCHRFSEPLLQRMKIVPPEFVSHVVATRNFYTHTGRPHAPRKREVLIGGPLFLLNQKMRALLRGVLLRHLGVPETQISDVLVRQATQWR